MTNTKAFLAIFICMVFSLVSKAQIVSYNDSLIGSGRVVRDSGNMIYYLRNGETLVYGKPKKFGFITDLPKDASGIISTTFRKQSIKPALFIAGSTALLLLADQPMIDGVRQFSDNIHLHPEEENKNLLNFKLGNTDVSVLRIPANVNTAIYQVGQGFPSLLISAGLYTYGKINRDYRALSTASQLVETFILMGVSTQLVKRITGRQSPSEATNRGGDWDFFPSIAKYQKNTPNYDAFPSGHLATLMSSVTIFAGNYPEKKWIKPVGYSITGLVAFAMMNNKVHWASDYPLALGMGYVCANQVVKRSRKMLAASKTGKSPGELSYILNYANGTLLPGIVYKF